MVPVIETERLRLRGHRMDDFMPSAAMWADSRVTQFIGGRTFSEEETWARLLRYVGHWPLLGFGYWVVEERATASFAGEVGLADYKRQIEPSIKGMPELGWVLVPRVHGRGYATEAVRAALAWGEAHLTSSRTVCLIQPENVASIRVAGKCGFREYCRTAYKDQPVILFSRDRQGTVPAGASG